MAFSSLSSKAIGSEVVEFEEMGKLITDKEIDDFFKECDVHIDREVQRFYEHRRQMYPPIGAVMLHSFDIVFFLWFTLSVVMAILFIVIAVTIAVMTFFICMVILICIFSAQNDGSSVDRRIGYRHAVAVRRR
ncbi:uncharacterized protein LOC127858451 isoform X2 [Dreissena polymorpha]|uniref:uncharacterized protein LOC127858451 isoform X2 n=1 Tax=Dreissena polymorpha TaxID=45954 RepID=UPI0022640AC2|nr:uncharacterized protein LOC127858451 isoform X2 [Dreissena polymorpha]